MADASSPHSGSEPSVEEAPASRWQPAVEGAHPSDVLVASYFPLVHRVVAGLVRRLPAHVVRNDLVAAGVVGLVDSLRRHQGERNEAFECYARTRIRGAIFDELRAQDWLSRRARSRVDENGVASTSFVSLDEMSHDDGAQLKDEIDPASVAEARCDHRLLRRALTQLPERERKILAMYYFEDLRLKEISAVLGVSEPRISQLHARALTLLRSLFDEAA